MTKIHNLPVVVLWSEFHPGASFFIPCINRKQMQKFVQSEAARLRFTVMCKQVVENGMYGLRVWRIPPTMASHSCSSP